MKQLSADIFRLLKGFLVGLSFALCVMLGLNYNEFYNPEPILELPIIQQLSIAYEEIWEAPYSPSSVKSGRTSFFFDRKKKQSSETNLEWNQGQILAKLKENGFSKGKLKSAKRYLDYIEDHKEIAMEDMAQSGVFASIKLAQALLESAAGSSKLARATNNHFGIKARANKIGRQKIRKKQFKELTDYDFTPARPAIGVFRMTDDNYHDRFERYHNVGDSYFRHTQLLTRDCTLGKVGCYGWIWENFPVGKAKCDISSAALSFYSFSKLSPNYFFDGKVQLPYFAAAAAGLKMAGYATSKTYHKKLSYIISTYELWKFDLAVKHSNSNF